MFKSIFGVLKGLGKKAIGFVRGLNGNKAAKLLAGSIQKGGYPFKAAVPFLKGLGSFINEKLDEVSKEEETSGGIQKPSVSKRQLRRLRARQREEQEAPIGTKDLFAEQE